MKYDYAVIIGRVQPPHKAHLKLIHEALEKAPQLIFVLGSKRCAPNIRNPFTVEEREQMLRLSLGDLNERVTVVTVRDYLYNDMVWLTEVQQKVREIAGTESRICICGAKKDYTSYYLDFFHELWTPEYSSLDKALNSTDVREAYFSGDIATVKSMVHPETLRWLKAWSNTPEYQRLCDEFNFVKDYQANTQPKELIKALQDIRDSAEASTSAALEALIKKIQPHPVQFVTCDAVVVCSGHVLICRRKGQPGKGLLALPGGFVNPHEKIENAVFRELKEETGIQINKAVLRKSCVAKEVFDHPDRSVRGRTVTHAYFVKLDDRGLPGIKAGSDAEDVFWMPLSDLFMRENEFFEDHIHVLSSFIFHG